MLAMYEVEPEFHNGLRKTTEQTLEIAELVLIRINESKTSSKINK